jgi:hypothetical protein
VNEIWNAQKEEFGRAKPQMVLQQGKLGIGTDAPQGSLSVADEPHNLEEFPPRAMSGYKTYFEGHGEFCVSASDEFIQLEVIHLGRFSNTGTDVLRLLVIFMNRFHSYIIISMDHRL